MGPYGAQPFPATVTRPFVPAPPADIALMTRKGNNCLTRTGGCPNKEKQLCYASQIVVPPVSAGWRRGWRQGFV